jgi:flagellar FliL protein
MAKKDTKLAAAPDGDAKPKKPKKKLVLIAALVLVLAAGGGGYWFFVRDSAPAAPVEGVVVPLDPININLAGGHYLKVGLALQAIEGASHEPDGSKALDLMISELSHRTVAELSSNATREKVKEELLKKIEKEYHHDVMDVYFTEFVMQ